MKNYKLNKVLRTYEPLRHKQFVNLECSSNIVVLYEGNSILELNTFAKEIHELLADKNVTICAYLKKIPKHETDKKIHFSKLITSKQLSIWGTPKKADIEWLATANCDILINLESKPNAVLNILTAASKASLKCGSGNNNHNILDFMIAPDSNNDRKALLEQILFYLNTIKIKN